MKGEELRSARISLNLSTEDFARLVRVESGRAVRRWEKNERAIPGPVIVIVEAIMKSASVRRYFKVAFDAKMNRRITIFDEQFEGEPLHIREHTIADDWTDEMIMERLGIAKSLTVYELQEDGSRRIVNEGKSHGG